MPRRASQKNRLRTQQPARQPLLPWADGLPRALLRSLDTELSLREAKQAALVGYGYFSADEVASAVQAWRSRLERVLVVNRVPVDFGDRAPQGIATAALLEQIEDGTSARTLNGPHGPLVYENDPPPDGFIRVGSAKGVVVADEVRLTTTFASEGCEVPTSEAESVAFGLFSASFDVASDALCARLILLVQALEVMAVTESRDPKAQELIDRLVGEIREAAIQDQDRQCLIVAERARDFLLQRS